MVIRSGKVISIVIDDVCLTHVKSIRSPVRNKQTASARLPSPSLELCLGWDLLTQTGRQVRPGANKDTLT